jgi:hypothetical protein
MERQMTKTALLESMQAARLRWDRILEEVDQNRMTLPVLHGGWSVKDTVGHVAYYERWLLDWLEAAVRGQVTYASLRDSLDVDARNALIWGENKDRPLAEILSESKYVFERLFRLVKVLPESDLVVPFAYDRYVIPFWGESLPLWKCIAGDSFEHYCEHTANIRHWLDVEIVESGPAPNVRPFADRILT